jgi:aldehyde:ferredoxin oxidoreductase
MAEFGYAGEILKVDLSSGKTTRLATSDYASRFLGGRGIATRLYWDMVPPETGAMEPENCLICATGPVTGFFGLAGCRWVICGKSPARQPEAFSYGNLGGKWGPTLKYAGYDCLAVQGQAEKPVYLFIHDGTVEIRDAAALWGSSAFDTSDSIRAELGKEVSVLAIGPAAENMVAFATALADGGASVSSGLGSVMGSKRLKAIAIAGNKRPNAAHPDRLQQLVERLRQMRGSVFTGPSPWGVPGITVKENCYGCGIGCNRQAYSDEKGRRFKSFCQATGVYAKPVMDYYGKWNEVQMRAVRLCDGYGLDTVVMMPLIRWLIDCYKEGIVDEKETGLPLSQAGSAEFIEALTRKIALREGFGDVLARGTLEAAGSLGERAEDIAHRYIATSTSETKDYDPRLILTTALFYATEPRRPVQQLHAVSGNTLIMWANWARGVKGAFFSTDDLREAAARFWGGTMAADFSTYRGKALAAKKIQDRAYVQESLVLCDVHWPTTMTSADYAGGHVGDPALESQIFSAITGKETDEEGLYLMGERTCNLQRAIQLRQGWGGRKGDRILDYFFREPLKKGDIFYNPDALMPGPDGKIISKIGAVVAHEEFEKMKSEYYGIRGWDVETGFPTRARLEELGLGDIVNDLEKRGLLGH